MPPLRSLGQAFETFAGVPKPLAMLDQDVISLAAVAGYALKSRRLAIAVFVPVLLACMVGAIALWHDLSLFYPTPETESAFLRSYTPKHVIDRFRENKSSSFSGSKSAGAGHAFVTHQAGFEFRVVLRRENWLLLMNALRDDVLEQLANNEAEVLSERGNPQDGFRFDYRINRSIGSVIISPVAMNSRFRRNMPLPDGMDDVTVKIEQTEKWFPKGLGTTQASLTGFLHK